MEGPHGEDEDALQHVEAGGRSDRDASIPRMSNRRRSGSGPYCYCAVNREGVINYANQNAVYPQCPP